MRKEIESGTQESRKYELKATGTQSGLLLNFAAMPLTVKRVGREFHSPS